VFNLQGSEIIVILLIALVVLGPERLPDTVRRVMKTYNELRQMSHGFQSEIKAAFDEPMKEMRDTAKLVRDSVDPTSFVAEAEAEQRLRAETAPHAWSPPAGPASAAPSSNGTGNGTSPAAATSTPAPPPPPVPPTRRPVQPATADGTKAVP
jgi:sec-independent protein translocase protein TatB